MNNVKNLLTKLVSIKSVYPHEREIGQFISDYFNKLGIKTKKQVIDKKRYNLIIEKGTGKKTISLYSHLDTIGETDGWLTDPYLLTVKGDQAYGLGAWDMKAGMTANILAFLNYQPKNFKLQLIFCVDEENISYGAYQITTSDFIKKIQCIISTEPAFKYGLAGITKGRIGRAVYQVEITTLSRHFAFYEKKYDINLLTAQFIIELQNLHKNAGQDKKQYLFARKIESQTTGLSLPEKTMIELDSSIIPGTTSEDILSEIAKITKKLLKNYPSASIKLNYRQRETPFLESYEINENNRYLRLLSDSVQNVTHKKARPYFRSSVADENVFAKKKITVLGIGPEGGNAHAPNEWVSITSIEKLIKILTNFLNRVDKEISIT